ncbi:hypothetical protein D3C72_2247710 [compost metagenome]
MLFDGVPPVGVPAGAGAASAKIKPEGAAQRSVAAQFNGERVVGQTWPAASGHLVFLELTY